MGKIFGGGKSSTTVINQTPPPTDTEISFQEKQLELADAQLAALKDASAFQKKQFEAFAPLIEQIAASTATQIELNKFALEEAKAAASAAGTPEERAARLDRVQQLEEKRLELETAQVEQSRELLPLTKESLELQLESARRALEGPTPEQIAKIDELTGAQEEAGLIDIDRFEQESLQRIRDELAPSRGLSPTDTPIREVADRVAAEALRQRGSLKSSLLASNIAAKLNQPSITAGAVSGAAGPAAQLSTAAANFQQTLREAAAQARIALASGQSPLPSVTSSGIGLAGVGSGVSTAGANMLAQTRLGNSTQTTFGKQSPGFLGFAQGIGGLAFGLGALRG